MKALKNIYNLFLTFTESLILKGIKFYQKTLSPDHGLFKSLHHNGYCKFYPTCSEYCYQAIKKYGLWKGGFKCIKRIFKCTPWSKGGIDKP